MFILLNLVEVCWTLKSINKQHAVQVVYLIMVNQYGIKTPKVLLKEFSPFIQTSYP